MLDNLTAFTTCINMQIMTNKHIDACQALNTSRHIILITLTKQSRDRVRVKVLFFCFGFCLCFQFLHETQLLQVGAPVKEIARTRILTVL